MEYLPQHDGWLPKWQLVVAGMSIFNTIQNLVTLSLTKRIYNRAQVTSLQSRTFAIWTFTAALVRLACAYDISNKTLYLVTIGTFFSALFHFSSEILVFGTISLNVGVISPLIVALSSIYWMLSQYNFYVAS